MQWRRDRVWKRCGERMVDLHDLETRERVGWWNLGTLAMIWSATSYGRFGISCGCGWVVDGDGGSEVVGEVSPDIGRRRILIRTRRDCV